MKICFLIPDGVGIRNYLYSNIIPELNKLDHEVVLWHCLGNQVLEEAESLHNIALKEIPFIQKPEAIKVRLWREAITFARLKLNQKKTKNETILNNWANGQVNFIRKILFIISEIIGGNWKSEDRIIKEENRLNSFVRKTNIYLERKKELSKIKPDVIFCTHQRVPSILPVMLAAEDLKIRTITAIYSWDNLPKARLSFRADEYFVWSKFMKEELSFYYSDIKSNQIMVTGTPQFDFYNWKELIISRKKFAEKYDLGENKKWILFSGDDKTTSPYDADYLKDVAEELNKNNDFQLLFRQVPIESVKRYEGVLNKYPKIKHISPLWENGNSWNSFLPLFDDVQLLVNLAFHCNVVINIGSTMVLDFACFKKVGLFLNYDQDHTKGWSVKTIYRFQHFKTMEGLDAVGWIKGKSEILEKVNEAIYSPGTIATEREKWFDKITGFSNVELSSSKIVQAINRKNEEAVY